MIIRYTLCRIFRTTIGNKILSRKNASDKSDGYSDNSDFLFIDRKKEMEQLLVFMEWLMEILEKISRKYTI
ncbi:hypothetical protein BpHYR1_037085 [Brachionus plicatilis]|uniref:Uncharacterized protein n=1 Tax=Brachionus plicatilis TaxID=10195 RepID=A0A3M7SBH2_BRAPC|nr:hypothetical protein BpHYR1_037085 [Brachionus plicatilis]